MRRRSRSSPPGATVTSTAELPCSATPTVAVRCVRPLSGTVASTKLRLPQLVHSHVLERLAGCHPRAWHPRARVGRDDSADDRTRGVTVSKTRGGSPHCLLETVQVFHCAPKRERHCVLGDDSATVSKI